MMGWTNFTSEAGEPFSVRGRIWFLVTVNKGDSTLSRGSVALGTPWVKYLRSFLLGRSKPGFVGRWTVFAWLQTSGEILFLFMQHSSLCIKYLKWTSVASWVPRGSEDLSPSALRGTEAFLRNYPPVHFYCAWVNSPFFGAEGKRLKDSFCVASKL